MWFSWFAALALPVLATAQDDSQPSVKLNLEGITGFGGNPGFSSVEPAKFAAAFRVVEGTRKGTLSVSATIEPEWHVYSITQPEGGPTPSTIKVKETADATRKASAGIAVWLFISLLCGAFFASLSATIGGRHRDVFVHGPRTAHR